MTKAEETLNYMRGHQLTTEPTLTVNKQQIEVFAKMLDYAVKWTDWESAQCPSQDEEKWKDERFQCAQWRDELRYILRKGTPA